MMDLAELQIKRAQVRIELNGLTFRYQRLGERLDGIAKELETIESEIIIAKLEQYKAGIAEAKAAGKMEMV